MLFRLLDTPPAPGAWNMAVDRALLEAVRDGAPPVLRFYRWRPRCLSLGRNQPARGEYNEIALRERGVDVVRRPTGGRAVLHDRELTYAALFPEGVLGRPRESYAAINRALAAGLRHLGVEAVLQPRTTRRAAAPSLAPCFREPAEGEVVVGGRKLIGSAQYREGGVVLQHGSLLLEDSQTEIAALLARPATPLPEDRPATLADALPALPAWEDLTAALARGWREVLGATLHQAPLSPAESRRSDALAQHFADLAWTWRL